MGPIDARKDKTVNAGTKADTAKKRGREINIELNDSVFEKILDMVGSDIEIALVQDKTVKKIKLTALQADNMALPATRATFKPMHLREEKSEGVYASRKECTSLQQSTSALPMGDKLEHADRSFENSQAHLTELISKSVPKGVEILCNLLVEELGREQGKELFCEAAQRICRNHKSGGPK